MIRLGRLLPPFVRRRVGLQLVAVCATVLAAAAVLSGTYTTESQKRVVLAEVDRQGQMLTAVAAMGSVEALVTADPDIPVLQTLVELMVGMDRVSRAEIVRADGVSLASDGESVPGSALYEAPILAPDGKLLGQARVEISTDHAASVAAASARMVFNHWGTTFLVLAVALAIVFRFIVHGRLDRLARQAVRLGNGDLETPIALTAADEFGQLAATLDSVRRRLRESYRDLQVRNEQLQELDRLKSEFMANVSHEIRTPLNGILGFVEVLLHRDLEPDVLDALETIFGSARSLQSVVDDVLEFSKLEAGEVRIAPEPVDLRELLADVAQLHAPTAWGKGLEMVIDVHRAVPDRVQVDPLRLRQVIGNLVNNAVKFTSQGEITVRADVLDRGSGGQRLRVMVTDTGIGFAPAVRGRLFASFQQADGSVSRRFGGTGLGLAIARHLVNRMGGVIDADSVLGAGSRFWFEIDLQPVADQPERPRPPDGPVLVIAACDSLRAALCRELDAFGCRWQAAADAAGCSVPGVEAPAAVLLAVDGPAEGLGPKLAAARATFGSPATRFVLLVPPHVTPPAALGADAVLPRPVRASRLRAAVAGSAAGRDGRELPAAVATGRPARVLVVDDNPVNCRLAAAMLKRLGHEFVVATSGAQAIELLAGGESEFDLVLMDCQMPDIDGYEATRRIRALPGASAGIPIVACTANNLAGDDARCRQAGMDDYLAKPLDLTKLGGMVGKWLSVAVARAGR